MSTDLTPIYAAGDLILRSVESARWLASPTRQGHVDYSLVFEVPSCPHISVSYGHIAELDPALEAELPGATCGVYSTESETLEACGNRVDIPVPAGTVLGQAGGTITGLDFDLFDDRVTFEFVAVHRYPQARRAICPQPLFVPALRDFLLDLTGLGEVRRTAEPRCGEMEIDVAGTAQGMWVQEGHDVTHNNTTFDRFFALAPHDIQPERFHVIVTAHPAFELEPWGYMIYVFDIQDEGRVNRPFADVPGDGTLFCYVPVDAPSEIIPVPTVSFLLALGEDHRITIERRDHAIGESPCLVEEPEAWAFSGAQLRLMR